MLANVVLASTNIPALIALHRLTTLHMPPPSRLRAALALSALFSACYHLCEHSVRGRGLSGIGLPHALEVCLLLLDRVAALCLAFEVFLLSGRSLPLILSTARRDVAVVAAAVVAGVVSELPPVFGASELPSVFGLVGLANVSGCRLLFKKGDLAWWLDRVTLGGLVLGGAWFAVVIGNLRDGKVGEDAISFAGRKVDNWGYVITHGLWHVLIFTATGRAVEALCKGMEFGGEK